MSSLAKAVSVAILFGAVGQAAAADTAPVTRALGAIRANPVATRLSANDAFTTRDVDQEARVVRMLRIDEPQRRVGQVMLADFGQHARDLEDVPGARMHGALAGLEGVERRFARQARRMAGLRQHGVRHRAVRCMADQLDTQHFRFAEPLVPEMVDGLLPQGLEIGLLHDGYPRAAGAGATRS